MPSLVVSDIFFFFKQKTAYEISACLVGSEMCIRDSSSTTDDSYDESTSYEETSSSSGETSDVKDAIGEVTYKSSSCLVMSVYEAAGK